MLKRTLLSAAGIALAFTTARAERPEYRTDGSVRVGSQVFPTLQAYYASPTFQESGARCGSTELAPTTVPSALAPADCTMQSTTINPLYNDDRTFVIQVVFHVIKKANGQGDVSPALIQSQIDVLNEDFRALMGTPGAPGTNTKIQFVLAKFTPTGQPTTGINVVTNDGYFQDPGGGLTPMKAALNWDTKRYLNIYTNDAAGYLGYATFPQEDAGKPVDGVVLLWSSVGRNSLGGPPYNLGRTATHEVGHWLGLFHTFQSGCGTAAQPYTTGDLISDTNREKDPQFGCTPSASACAGAGMNPIENYMDYSDDVCMNKFTAEQMNRMRCVITSYRFINTAPKAQFTHTAVNKAVTFTNTSTDAESALTLLKSQWTFGDGMTSTDPSPTHTYAADGTYNVKLEVIDPGSGTSTVTQSVVVVTTPSGGGSDGGMDPGGDDNGGGDGGGDDGRPAGGCCQAPNSGTSFVLCALPVVFVLLRRRRRA